MAARWTDVLAGAAGAGYMMARPPLVEIGVKESIHRGNRYAAFVQCAEKGAFSTENGIDAIGPREGRTSMCWVELPQ